MIEKAGDLLKGILGEQKLNTAKAVSALFSGWQKVAGTDIASHSRIKDVRHGVIIVEVDHPGWIQMIQMKRKPLLKSLAASYKELNIKDMRCVLQTDAQPDDTEPEYTYNPPEESLDDPAAEHPGREGFDELLDRLGDSISRRDKDLES